MRKALILFFSLLPASLMWLSCGYSSPSGSTRTSGITYRAFITNSASVGTSAAGVYIVNAQTDQRPIIPPIGAGNTPGMMVVTPNRTTTLVFSGNGTQGSDNALSFINNTAETNAAHLILPGGTESFVVSPDSSTAYVAVPTAPVVGQSPGIVDVVALNSASITATINCPPYDPRVTNPVCVPNLPPPCAPAYLCGGFNPGFRFLSIGNTGNRILAFAEGSDDVANAVAVITPTSIGTLDPVVTFVPGFDHPVAAFFSTDDTVAYVLNCGAECGGQQASIQQLNLTSNTLGAKLPICTPDGTECAGTVALVDGPTMYVAGTPYIAGVPSQPCTGQTTAATTCGLLTIIDLPSMTVTNAAPIIITDGYHNHLSLAANGRLYIGARTCSEIVPPVPPPPGAETRGCLSIYSLQTGAVVIPPANGDVTGIQPIAKRTVVYVIQGGTIGIYDSATDKLQEFQITNVVGQFVDVKTIDF